MPRRNFQTGLRVAAGLLVVLCAVAVWRYGAAPLDIPPASFCFVQTEEDADCAVVRSDGVCIVIDTGEPQDGETLVAHLQEQGVTSVDYLILTHPDKDHVGGASLLWERLSVGEVLVPCYEKADKKRYQAFLHQVSEDGGTVRVVEAPLTLPCGGAEVTIYPPEKQHYQESNDYSLAVLVEHGRVNAFYPGDAEEVRMEELLRQNLPRVTLYKAARHGRDEKNGIALLDKLRPRYTVVTAKEPEKNTAEALEKIGSTVFSAREQTWCFVSDGRSLHREEP